MERTANRYSRCGKLARGRPKSVAGAFPLKFCIDDQ